MQKELCRLRVGEIVPYENNPRKNDFAVESVAESIRQCEYISPIVIDENNIVLAGHTRLKALIYLNEEEIECLRVTGLTEEQKKKFRLLDNKTNELAGWDFDLLAGELVELDFSGYDFGFNTEKYDIGDLFEEAPDKEKAPKLITCPFCKEQFEA